MEFETAKQIVEAVIFASDVPVTDHRLNSVIENESDDTVKTAIDELNREYRSEGRSFEIRKVGGGWQLMTLPQFAPWIKKYQKGRARQRLSRASLEALSIIAYKQPVSRTEVGAIRGVNSDGVFKNLLERRLITLAGRAETVGRPLLYKTSDYFLSYFGINDISDLPTIEEIEQLLAAREPTRNGDGEFQPVQIDEGLVEERLGRNETGRSSSNEAEQVSS